jgi:ABC-type branched-subunit amino acid transport system substrate-binding protein
MRRKAIPGVAAVLAIALLAAACGSTKKVTEPTTVPTGSLGSTTTAVPQDLGQGVTATTIKMGVALVDFTCIQQFVDQIRVNQQQVYQSFIDGVNKHGGINGRQIVPIYRTFCPINSSGALALCTKFADDDKVFAVMGNLFDNSGDAQTCLAKQHHIILMTFQLTQAIINMSPPGLIILPGANPERIDSILLNLLQSNHTLDGKKIGVLGEISSQSIVQGTIEPALKKLGVSTGSTAILTINGPDTSAAQTQLTSFIERWKSEHVDTLFVSGTEVASQQFIEKVRGQMPNVALITDITDVLGYGKQEYQKGRHPNPYEGIVSAGGPNGKEYDASDNWKYCAQVYQAGTGLVAPNTQQVIPGPNGKTLDTNGSINDACQLVTMFSDIATRVGADLNATNWQHTVDNFGPIRNMGGGPYASLHAGKYDIDDTFRLEKYDSSIPPQGDWSPLTPLENVSGA